MKTYVFVTVTIQPVGGMQHYVASKAKYLQEQGWNVKILNTGSKNWIPAIPYLRSFLDGNLIELRKLPMSYSNEEYQTILETINQYVGDSHEEIIVESQESITALWGELLAKEWNCKNYCFICNEYFRGTNRYYPEYLDFFDFKHKRKELAGIAEHSLPLLFEGYKEVPPEERAIFCAGMEPAVQDVFHEQVESIQRSEWNIAYVGRTVKGYVKGILKDIKKFTTAHPETEIQFIIVGKVDPIEEELDKMKKTCPNLKITSLGDLIPIPKSLYSKIDVVIAGSGCAYYSAFHGNAITILADANNYKASGVIGYDTQNYLVANEGELQNSYDYFLEKVLVEHFYEDKILDLVELMSPSTYYEQHFEMINQSNQDKVYYSMEKFKEDYLKSAASNKPV